jgi:hypothetical protein
MKQRKHHARFTPGKTFKLIFASSLFLSGGEIIQAAEPQQTYSRVPMAAYNA